MSRVAVLTLDSLAAKMAGPAIRVWEMSRQLAHAGHDVRLITFGRAEVQHPDFTVEVRQVPELVAIADWADVLVVQGVLMLGVPALRTTSTPIVADLYDPFHLESLEVDRFEPAAARWASLELTVAELDAQLRRCDLFLCASEKQRDFWLGHLALAGRVNPLTYDDDPDLRRLLATAPFGLAAEPPVRTGPALRGVVEGIGADDKVVIWGGGVYNWFDPLTLVRAVDRARERVPTLRLYFLGMKHPNPDVPTMQVATATQRLADDLGLTDRHVFFNYDWVDYDRRGDYLLDADLGVSCHYQHVETSFSFRTRILDYLWAGLPIVSTAGDTFAAIVEQRGLGRVVPAEDVDALADALTVLLTDDTLRARCRASVVEVAGEFVWPVALAPLLEFCAAPHRAADHVKVDELAAAARRPVGRRTPREQARIALDHLRDGGPAQVRDRALTRVRRQWAARRSPSPPPL